MVVYRALSVRQGIEVVKKGGVIAYPTETVYGLGVDARNARAVQSLYRIKGRELAKAISILVADSDELKRWVSLDQRALSLIEAFWPGPLTLVMRAKRSIPGVVSAAGRIGVRISSHPIAQELVTTVGALTTTSANRSGENPCRSGPTVFRKLGGDLDGVVGGERLYSRKSSTVLDISDRKIKVLRNGVITLQQIEEKLNHGPSEDPTV